MTRQSLRTDERGVSEVIGYVLVITLVLATVAFVSVAGISVLEGARDAEQIDNAERAYDLLADNMEDLYKRGAPSRSTEVKLGSAQLVSKQTTTIQVTWTNGSGFRKNYSTDLWSLTYRGGSDSRLIYDAGAVFRQRREGTGGIVLREPPIVTTPERTSILIPRLEGGGVSAVSGSTVLVRANRKATAVNVSLDGGQASNIQINVTAPHWELWEEALSARDNIENCTNPDGTNTVSCDISTSPERFTVAWVKIRVSLVR